MKEELNIQFSTTSLANSDQEPKTAATTLLRGLLDSNYYAEKVQNNAENFKKETLEVIPKATFGVSILPTMISKDEIYNFEEYLESSSIDIPYIIDWFKLPAQKAKEIVQKDGIGVKSVLNYSFEIAYAMMQAKNPSTLENILNDTVEAFPNNSPITLRTCIENASDTRVLKEVLRLSKNNPNIKLALEPNDKIVQNLSEYMNYIENISSDNPDLRIGLDLDLTHLKEHDGLLNILERLKDTKNLPLIISIGGNVLRNDVISASTHLPLSTQNPTVVRDLGNFYKKLKVQGKELPSLIFETSPTEQGVFESYQEFLKSFKKGYGD